MSNQFEQVMSKRTDAELLQIINSEPGHYQRLALEAADIEFKKRNLSDEQLLIAEEVINQKQEIDTAKSNAPLGPAAKFFALLFPGLLMLLFSGNFYADGYYRKSKELRRWTLYGLCAYGGLIVLSLLSSYFS